MLQHRQEGMSHLRNGKVGTLAGDDRMTGTGEQAERSGVRSQWNGLNTRIYSYFPLPLKMELRRMRFCLDVTVLPAAPWSRDGG